MKKRLIIIGIVLLVLVIWGTLIQASNSNSPPADPDEVAKNSIPTTQTPSFNASLLTENGVTPGQLNNMEEALTQYLSSNGLASSKISFNSIERQPTNPNTTTPETEQDFIIQVNGTNTYRAKLFSYSFSTIRLYLYNLSGNTLLYDSQDVGSSS